MIHPVVSYLLIGLLNTGLGLGAILLLQNGFGVAPALANAVGYGAGLGLSYALNRRFTFRSTRSHRSGLPLFLAMAGVCYLLNLGVLSAGLRAGWAPSWAQVLALASYTVAFYLLNRTLVFRRTS